MQIKDIDTYSTELNKYPSDTELDGYIIIKAPEPWRTNTIKQPNETTQPRIQSFCCIFTQQGKQIAISDRGQVSIKDAENAINQRIGRKKRTFSDILIWNPPACQNIIISYHILKLQATIYTKGIYREIKPASKHILTAKNFINNIQIIREHTRHSWMPQESTEKSRYMRFLSRNATHTWTTPPEQESTRPYITDEEYHTGISTISEGKYHQINK